MPASWQCGYVNPQSGHICQMPKRYGEKCCVTHGGATVLSGHRCRKCGDRISRGRWVMLQHRLRWALVDRGPLSQYRRGCLEVKVGKIRRALRLCSRCGAEDRAQCQIFDREVLCPCVICGLAARPIKGVRLVCSGECGRILAQRFMRARWFRSTFEG